MIVSVVVALAGIGAAVYFFLENRAAADTLAERFSGVHRVLAHKYYVDEIYDTAIVQPIRIVSEDGLWKGVDVGVIDRTVNGVGRQSPARAKCCVCFRQDRCGCMPRRCFSAWCSSSGITSGADAFPHPDLAHRVADRRRPVAARRPE